MDNLATVVFLRHKRDEIREQLNAAQKHYTEVFLSEYRVKAGDEIKRGLERIKVEDVRLGEHDEVLIYGRRVTRSGKLSGIYQVVPRGKQWQTEDGRAVYDEA
jgi:hypothetical protein